MLFPAGLVGWPLSPDPREFRAQLESELQPPGLDGNHQRSFTLAPPLPQSGSALNGLSQIARAVAAERQKSAKTQRARRAERTTWF